MIKSFQLKQHGCTKQHPVLEMEGCVIHKAGKSPLVEVNKGLNFLSNLPNTPNRTSLPAGSYFFKAAKNKILFSPKWCRMVLSYTLDLFKIFIQLVL